MEKIKSEKQKMIDGELYFSADPELVADRRYARAQASLINSIVDLAIRKQAIKESFGTVLGDVHIEPCLSFDYGFNIHIGKNFYANFNNIYLDVCPIRIGDNCVFGPNVQLYTATYPLEPAKRSSGLESGKPITIGNNVWLAGSVVIVPGVTLGNNVIVAAGAIVTKSFPDNCLIGGNPAKIIRKINQKKNSFPLEVERGQINQIDQKITELLEERLALVEQIAGLKKEHQYMIEDAAREKAVLNNVQSYVKNATYQATIRETYLGIIEASKKFQKNINHLEE